MNNALGFEDVVLIPKYSQLETRKNASTILSIFNCISNARYTFKVPVCPSNMFVNCNKLTTIKKV